MMTTGMYNDERFHIPFLLFTIIMFAGVVDSYLPFGFYISSVQIERVVSSMMLPIDHYDLLYQHT